MLGFYAGRRHFNLKPHTPSVISNLHILNADVCTQSGKNAHNWPILVHRLRTS